MRHRRSKAIVKGHRIGVRRQRCNRAAPSPFSCSYSCSCSCSFACGTRPKFSNKRTIHRHKRERGKYGNGFRRASGMPVVVGRARLVKRTFFRPSQSLTGPFPLSFWTGLTDLQDRRDVAAIGPRAVSNPAPSARWDGGTSFRSSGGGRTGLRRKRPDFQAGPSEEVRGFASQD